MTEENPEKEAKRMATGILVLAAMFFFGIWFGWLIGWGWMFFVWGIVVFYAAIKSWKGMNQSERIQSERTGE